MSALKGVNLRDIQVNKKYVIINYDFSLKNYCTPHKTGSEETDHKKKKQKLLKTRENKRRVFESNKV